MNKKAKTISLLGLGSCLALGAVLFTTIGINGFKIKASNEETYTWRLQASDFQISTGSPHDYCAYTPSGTRIYFCVSGFNIINDTMTLFGTDDPSSPCYLSNYEELDEESGNDEIISAIRGIQSITLEGEEEAISNLKVMVGQEGIHGSCANDSDMRENLVDIKNKRDDVNYNFFYIENKTNTNINIDAITIEYICSEKPLNLNIPFIFQANEQWEEYSVRFDIDFLDHPYSYPEMFIPAYYNGLPVTKIYGEDSEIYEKLCFQDLKGMMYVPVGVKEIGPYSFDAKAFEDENSGVTFAEGASSWTAKKGIKSISLTFGEDTTRNEDGNTIASYVSDGYTLTKN